VLFGHEVGDHVGRRSEGGGNIAQLDMLAAEVDAHVDVARIWFVGGVKCHGTAMVMAPLLSQKSVVGRDLMDKSSPPRGWDVIATVYPEVYPSDMPPILARLEPSHVYIRPH
jgi:hypothetical protein